MKKIFILALFALVLFSCKKGELNDNLLPDTRISISEINLTGPDRLTSEVTLHWIGSDQDGYITGYEISFDGTTWTPTTDEDSTFRFDISGGADTIDIDFYVRAIDNLNGIDPEPAYLKIPIKNSPPEVKFDSTRAINDTCWVVFSTFWNASDPDGDETIDTLQIKINNGNWYTLDPSITLGTFKPVDPTLTGSCDAEVYSGLGPTLESGTIDGLILNGLNQVFIRAKDIAGSWSTIDSTEIFYLKNKTSDLLVIDANAGGAVPSPEEVYFPILTAEVGAFDYIDIQRNTGENVPALWYPTFGMLMNLYDKVFFYADEGDYLNQGLYLEATSGVIQEYLNQGGKILISGKFPNPLDLTSPLYQYSPMDSLSSSVGQARVPTDSLIMPSGSFASSYDTMKSSAFITGADPFYIKSSAVTMFTAQITSVGGWTGPNVVAATMDGPGGNTNMVFVSLELHKLEGTSSALQDFFHEVLTNEFNW